MWSLISQSNVHFLTADEIDRFLRSVNHLYEHTVSLHVAVEWLAHLLRVRKVLGSDLRPEASCSQ
jgi:hypothetical protein